MAILNSFDERELLKLGYKVQETTQEFTLLANLTTSEEVILWRLGDWLQFRCRIVQVQLQKDLKLEGKILYFINQIHDLAIGARVVLDGGGDVTLVADLLHRVVDNEVVTKMADQMLFLSGTIINPLQALVAGKSTFTNEEIDELFSM